MRARPFVPVLCSIAWACDAPTGPVATDTGEPFVGGQSGSDPGAACVDRFEIGDPDDPIEGEDGPFTAAELLALADGTFSGPLAWSSGEETALVLALRLDGPIRLVEPRPRRACANRIEIDGQITVDSADGQLAETAAVVLSGEEGERAWFVASWDARTLAGTLPVPDDGRPWTLRMSGHADASGVSGTFSTTSGGDTTGGVATSSEGGGPMGTFEAVR